MVQQQQVWGREGMALGAQCETGGGAAWAA